MLNSSTSNISDTPVLNKNYFKLQSQFVHLPRNFFSLSCMTKCYSWDYFKIMHTYRIED